MFDLVAAFSFGVLVVGVPLYVLLWLVVRESQRREAAHQAQVAHLLDRIQEPDIERREALTRPVDEGPVPEWMYDDTGLVRVEVDPADAE